MMQQNAGPNVRAAAVERKAAGVFGENGVLRDAAGLGVLLLVVGQLWGALLGA